MKILATLLEADSGTVTMNDLDLINDPHDFASEPITRMISFPDAWKLSRMPRSQTRA